MTGSVKRAGLGLGLLWLMLPAVTMAADFTVTGISRDIDGSPPAIMTVPSVDVSAGSIDEAVIRAIFAEGIAGQAEALSKLDAKAITIPLLTIATKQAPYPLLIMRDISLKDVAGGVAASVSIADTELSLAADQDFKLGTVSAEQLDIGRLLGLYGLVELTDKTTPQPVYSAFKLSGLQFKTPEANCTVGPIAFGSLAARPLSPESMATLMKLAAKPENSELPPEEILPSARMYVDLLTAFRIGASSYGTFNCDGKDDEGKPIQVVLGGVTQAEGSEGHVSQITYSGISVTSGGTDTVKLGAVTLKPIDFSAAVNLIKAQEPNLTLEWLTANARKLIPMFDGMALADVAIDVPDPQAPGTRAKVDLKGFDLSLGKYVNAIPSQISASLDRLHVILPPTPDNQPMIAMGYGDLTGDTALSLHWDEAAKTIVIDELSTQWDKAGAVKISAVLGNATEGLFSDNPAVAMEVGQALTVKSLTVDLTDDGLLPQALAIAAAEQSVEPDAFRAAIAAMAKGMVVVGLGGTPESLTVSNAVTDFINGDAKHLVVTATAIDPQGLGMADFAATQTDPSALLKKVTLTATTGDAPEEATKPEAAMGAKNPARSN